MRIAMAAVLAASASPALFFRQLANMRHETGQQICMKETSKQMPTTEKKMIRMVENMPMTRIRF